MFVIYEEFFRYIGTYSRSTALGYVNTEDEARYTCYKLNKSVEGKNELNSMGYWRYYYERIDQYIGIEAAATPKDNIIEDEYDNIESLDL